MSEQQQTGRVRRRRSRAEAAQLAAEYETSGLSRAEFCRSRGLALSTLNRYWQRRRQAEAGATGAARWVAVEVSGTPAAGAGGPDSALVLWLSSGRRIEVGRGFDAPTLERLLGVLERH